MKIGMISLGCPKNLVDSEVMLGLAQQQGHELTREAADAEVLVVNTCAFIDKAKQDSIDAILEMAAHKKTGACRQLIVTGCMAERYRDELRAEIPEIDVVLGTGEVPRIVEALAGSASSDPTSTIPLLRADGSAVSARHADTVSLHTNPVARIPHSGPPAGLPTYIYDADTPRLLATPRH